MQAEKFGVDYLAFLEAWREGEGGRGGGFGGYPAGYPVGGGGLRPVPIGRMGGGGVGYGGRGPVMQRRQQRVYRQEEYDYEDEDDVLRKPECKGA